jgi:Subtilase family
MNYHYNLAKKALLLGVAVGFITVSTHNQAATPIIGVKPRTTVAYPVSKYAYILTPSITRHSAGVCANKGAKITLAGKNFGTSRGTRRIGMQGTSHLHPGIRSWRSTSIGITVPNSTSLKAGSIYKLYIESSTHKQSGNTVSLKICGRSIVGIGTKLRPGLRKTIIPSRIKPGLRVIPGGRFSPGGRGTRGGSRSPDGGGDPGYGGYDDGDYGGYDDGSYSGSTSSGGSLLGSGLPPPPGKINTKPVPKKEIKRLLKKIEAREVIVVSANMRQAQALAKKLGKQGIRVKRRRVLGGLGLVITTFRVSKSSSAPAALQKIRRQAPKQWMDVNHKFKMMGTDNKTFAPLQIGWRKTSNGCGRRLRIGLIDTGVDTSHPALKGRKIFTRSFMSTGISQAPKQHGTAVASILVGNDPGKKFNGLVPNATLYVGNVFRKSGSGVETTAEWIVLALNWLASQRVDVVNMSLGGPRNLLVEAAVKRLQQRNIMVVAAAGNNGPGGDPVFPAAQRGVIAVSAVDAKNRLYRKANQGNYISYVAPGVDIWAASANGKGSYFSGTSYASPYVAATYALMKRKYPKSSWNSIHKIISKQSRDLGNPGKDPAYGWGLIQAKTPCR